MTTLYILVAGFMATASFADMDPQRMQRDIRIMEGVLGNLHLDAPNPIDSSPRGLYLDSYGVLFLTERSWPRQAHPSLSAAWDEKGVKFLELKSGGGPSSYEKSLAEIHDLVAEFLGNYAGNIGQLDSDDRIMVCYQIARPSDLASVLENYTDGYTVGTDSASFDLTKQIEAIMPMAVGEGAFDFEKFVLTFGDSVSFLDTDKQVAAITRLRKHLEELPTESEVEVKGIVVGVRDSLLADVAEADAPPHGSIVAQVHGLTPRHHRAAAAASLITATAKKSAIDAFREGRIDSAAFRQRIAFSEHSVSKKIDIMAGILGQVSGQDHHPLIGSQPTLGMYQPDLGALFLINDSVFRFRPLPLDDVKANIVEAVADYGPTLSQLQSDEHVIIEYRTGRTTHTMQGPEPKAIKYDPDQTHLLRVPKSTIDAYARGDLDLDDFREKIVWETR